jgi:hypothetical protein
MLIEGYPRTTLPFLDLSSFLCKTLANQNAVADAR